MPNPGTRNSIYVSHEHSRARSLGPSSAPCLGWLAKKLHWKLSSWDLYWGSHLGCWCHSSSLIHYTTTLATFSGFDIVHCKLSLSNVKSRGYEPSTSVIIWSLGNEMEVRNSIDTCLLRLRLSQRFICTLSHTEDSNPGNSFM